MRSPVERLFKPERALFVGGGVLRPALRYHRDQGFAGETWVLNPTHAELEGYPCVADLADLPAPPDVAFIAVRRERAVGVIAALRDIGCGAVICNAAGFAEMGPEGAALQGDLIEAAGEMALLGPNAIGMTNFVDSAALMMNHFGVAHPEAGAAIVSQSGGFLCDMVFCDRGLPITHLVGCGNQATLTVADCAEHLLDDPRVRVVGLAFEGLPNADSLRRAAAKAARLGKALVALKFGKTAIGAQAAATHTASMTGPMEAWAALFDRLGVAATQTISEFIETLKVFASGKAPKGRRALVAAAAGSAGIMAADELSAAGFDLPQPGSACAERLRALLPEIATPANPQDVTMAAWNDRARQQAIYAALVEEGYDVAIIMQNYPRAGMWDIAEYAAQVEALAGACAESDVTPIEWASLVDCFPPSARAYTESLGVIPLQGLAEGATALAHGVRWRERQEGLALEADHLAEPFRAPPPSEPLDEAAAKAVLATAGVSIPHGRACAPEAAAEAAASVGFPVAVKALDARLTHKTEVGAVRIGLASAAAVAEAVTEMQAEMARLAPEIPLRRVLVEAMAPPPVAEIMASISHDPVLGPLMLVAAGGVAAELWKDSTLIAAPFDRAHIAAGLDRLKITAKLAGWRGAAPGDREALLDLLEALAKLGVDKGATVEINPIFVGVKGVVAVDAVMIMNKEAVWTSP